MSDTFQQTTTSKKFDWILNKCLFMDTIFNKKKILEFANVKKVYGFIKNQMGISYQGIKRYEYLSKVDSTELQQIIRFKELYKKN